MPLEIEIKLWIAGSLPSLRKSIRGLKFALVKRRLFEQNVLFDSTDLKLRRNGEMIRIRRVPRLGILTFKGPSIPGPHKSREELELEVSDSDGMELILARLGLFPVFRYEKFREEYARKGHDGTITLDQTPIGNFLELEGLPRWIDKTARELGFSRADYITRSYGSLYIAHCREHGIASSNMTFHHRELSASSRKKPARAIKNLFAPHPK